jgi:hypothetical protein
LAIPAPLINQTLPSEPVTVVPGLATPLVNSVIDDACASPGAIIATTLAITDDITTFKPLPVNPKTPGVDPRSRWA